MLKIMSGHRFYVFFVIKRSIITCYPDFGIAKYRVVFNQKVLPRCKDNCFVPFRILFCGLSNIEKKYQLLS